MRSNNNSNYNSDYNNYNYGVGGGGGVYYNNYNAPQRSISQPYVRPPQQYQQYQQPRYPGWRLQPRAVLRRWWRWWSFLWLWLRVRGLRLRRWCSVPLSSSTTTPAATRIRQWIGSIRFTDFKVTLIDRCDLSFICVCSTETATIRNEGVSRTHRQQHPRPHRLQSYLRQRIATMEDHHQRRRKDSTLLR